MSKEVDEEELKERLETLGKKVLVDDLREEVDRLIEKCDRKIAEWEEAMRKFTFDEGKLRITYGDQYVEKLNEVWEHFGDWLDVLSIIMEQTKDKPDIKFLIAVDKHGDNVKVFPVFYDGFDYDAYVQIIWKERGAELMVLPKKGRITKQKEAEIRKLKKKDSLIAHFKQMSKD